MARFDKAGRYHLNVKRDLCGHHSCAVSAGCGELTDCCARCPLPECRFVTDKREAKSVRSLSLHEIKNVERDGAIVELKREGALDGEIAEITELSRSRIQHILAINSVRFSGGKREFREFQCVCCGEAFKLHGRGILRRCPSCRKNCPQRGPHRFKSAPLKVAVS